MASRFTLSDEHRKLLAQIKFENTTKATKNNTLITSTCLGHSSRSQKPVEINILTDLYNKLINLCSINTSLAAGALAIVVNSLGRHMAATTPSPSASRSAIVGHAIGKAVLAFFKDYLEAHLNGIVDGAFDEVLGLILDVFRSYLRLMRLTLCDYGPV